MSQPTWTYRPYAGREDFERIADLMNACEAVDKLEWGITAEELEGDLTGPLVDLARDLRLWEDQQGRLVGYGEVQLAVADDHVTGNWFMLVDPPLRGQGLEEQNLAWAQERTREAGAERGLAPKLKTIGPERDTWRTGFLARLGTPARFHWRMRHDLAQPLPEPAVSQGYLLRPLRGDEEIEAWAAAYNDSFVDAWDFHPQTVEEARQYLRGEPYYRPDIDIVAEAEDGSLAGFCLSTINPAENERHERLEGGIRLLGTRRGHRGRGLGRALLLDGMRRLRDAGMESIWLGVDSSSPTGATRLYESVGFYQEHSYGMWLVDL